MFRTDQDKLPELVSRLEDAILLRQMELVTSADHYDERLAMKLATKTLLRIKTNELNVHEAIEAEPAGDRVGAANALAAVPNARMGAADGKVTSRRSRRGRRFLAPL